jgi:plasmid stability protein
MPKLTERNLPEETQRALGVRAAPHGRSIEAEFPFILDETVRPAEHLKIGSEIYRIAQQIGGMNNFKIPRRQSAIQGVDFE